MLGEHEPTETHGQAAVAVCGTGLALPEPGAIVGDRYRITRLIGAGGMGTVFEAESVSVGRRYALKFLRCERASRSHSGRRFEREARLLARMEHDHLTAVLDYGLFRGSTPYYAMEYLDGETLRQALSRQGALSLADAVELTRQICRGMAHAHERGVVHRDLKPDNLMLVIRSDGKRWIKILDFGVARWTEDVQMPLTPTGAELGTAHYMSPEQARGARNVDARSDIYSLGAIFYEMIAGCRVHRGDSYNEVLFQLLTQPHRPLREVLPSCPTAVDGLVERCLRAAADERFCNAGELFDALSQLELPTDSSGAGVSKVAPIGGVAQEPALKPSSRLPASWVGFVVGTLLGASATLGARRIMTAPPTALSSPGPFAEMREPKAPSAVRVPASGAAVQRDESPSAPLPPSTGERSDTVAPPHIQLPAAKSANAARAVGLGEGDGAAPPGERGTPFRPPPQALSPPVRMTEREPKPPQAAAAAPDTEDEFPFITTNPYQAD
jgi:serine/threonine-protein kinase